MVMKPRPMDVSRRPWPREPVRLQREGVEARPCSAGWCRRAGHVHQPRDHHEVAEQRGQFDDASLAPAGTLQRTARLRGSQLLRASVPDVDRIDAAGGSIGVLEWRWRAGAGLTVQPVLRLRGAVSVGVRVAGAA